MTAPWKRAFTGPMRVRTIAANSLSERFSRRSTPGMQASSAAGSFSASQTRARGAGMRYSPLSSIAFLRFGARRASEKAGRADRARRA